MNHLDSAASLKTSSSVPGPHPLDQPIWNALRSEHLSLSLGNNHARRYRPEIGPLSGLASQTPESYQALRDVTASGDAIVLFLEDQLADQPAVPDGWTLLRDGLLDQMILTPSAPSRWTDSPPLPGIRLLTNEDVPAMVELAQLTEPGPFRSRIIELGTFFGFFEEGRLLAMAGQRLHLPDFIEVSAVCTHPDARRRGLARILMIKVMREILSRGKTPFLHSFSNNHGAIRVYQDLGFTLRRTLNLSVLKRER